MKRILLAESADFMSIAFEGLGVKNKAFPMLGASMSGISLMLVPCVTLEAAKQAVHDDIDVVLCGLHFDECRMFDLLRFMKADPGLRRIPFLCIKTLDGTLDPTFNESVKIATQALGAAGFFDLGALNKKLGPELARNEIGNYIDRVISQTDKLT